MSIFNSTNNTCPRCGETVEISWAASVNAVRRPDLRAAILDRSFQAEDCPACGLKMRLPPHLTYVDMNKGNWILVEGFDEMPHWEAHEAEAKQLFDEAFGATAPASNRELAEGVSPRLVFGWPALREKILATELGLDDATLELLKIAVIRSVPGAPLADGRGLRLVGGDAATLKLEITDDATEETFGATDVPRSLYDDIAGDTAAWAPLRAKLSDVALVDLQRFTLVGA